MNTLLENNINKLLEEFLLVENLSFSEDIWEAQDTYFGKHIKRSEYYRKESKIPYRFPKHISVLFTKNGEKIGIKIKTKDFIVSDDYKYEKMDTVDMGDDMIRMEKSIFGKEKPLLLPYLFFGNKYRLDTSKFAKCLKQKINVYEDI